MEGLIPLVYKALKRRNTTKHYRSLSSGGALINETELDFNDQAFAAAAPSENQNAVFEMKDHHIFMTPQRVKLEDYGGKGNSHQKQGPMQALPREPFSPAKRADPSTGTKGYRGRSKSVA